MKQCSTCRFWLHPLRGNFGRCGKLTVDKKTPFWAKGVTNQTISWEGKGCYSWRKRAKKWEMK